MEKVLVDLKKKKSYVIYYSMLSNISYQLRKSARSKRLRITVYYDGRVVVAAPKHASSVLIERFVAEKQSWILGKLQAYQNIDGKSIRIFSKEDYHKNKTAALQLAQEKVAHYNQFYQFPFKKISIKNQKTRWGSCSAKGNLNFNYRILFLAPELQDYLVVHELCHLREMNHSSRFWRLVGQTLPNYVELRRSLRCEEMSLR